MMKRMVMPMAPSSITIEDVKERSLNDLIEFLKIFIGGDSDES